jgi:hypothetical protein
MANSLKANNNTNSYVGNLSKVKNLSTIQEIDRVNIYEFENGMDVELTELGGELTSENIRKAQSKVLANLKKDPTFYTNKIAQETVDRFGEYGSGKNKKGKYTNAKEAESAKADVKVKETKEEKDKNNEMKEISKVEKSNVSKDKKPTMAAKPKEMTQTPKKAKGIKSTMDMPGKEKKINLKENKEYQGISDEQKTKLEKTIEYLKQQGKTEMANALERLMKSGIKDLDEKLRKNAPVSKYVGDFEKSDAPQFKGKSPEKRRNMAIAAYAEKNPGKLKENVSSYPMDPEWVKQHYDVKPSEEGIKIFDKITGKEVTVYEVGEKWDEEQNKSLNEMDANQKRLSDINPNHPLVKKSSEEWTAEDNKEFKKALLSKDPMYDKTTQSLKSQAGGKIKLTKENIDMIQEMVIEAVAMVKSKSGTDAIDYKNPQELNTLRTDPNITSIKTTTGQKIK